MPCKDVGGDGEDGEVVKEMDLRGWIGTIHAEKSNWMRKK